MFWNKDKMCVLFSLVVQLISMIVISDVEPCVVILTTFYVIIANESTHWNKIYDFIIPVWLYFN